MNRKTRPSCPCLLLLTAIVAALSSMPSRAAEPRAILADTVAYWNMSDANNAVGDNRSLATIGEDAQFGVTLKGDDRLASLARGGDGMAVRLRNAAIIVGQPNEGVVNIRGRALTMLIRLRNDSADWNTTLFSKHGGHNILQYNIYCFNSAAGEFDVGTEIGTDRGLARTQAIIGKGSQKLWHDVVVRYTGSRVELFVDGDLLCSVPQTGELRPANGVPLIIGGEPTGDRITRRFTGLIDHAALWSRPLSDDEIMSISGTTRKGPYQERFRPQVHFSPPKNWSNDPNGLVYFDGEYHLYYQYNPFGNTWGHMSWGHAVSTDLLHWKHLPVVLPEDNGLMSFSGSAVDDAHNTSGFGRGAARPLIAIYTAHDGAKRRQTQCIASSVDRGRTFAKFAGNPVIDINEQDFRDPKVFWYEPDQRWVMVVSLANEHRVLFYGSTDLKKWDRLGQFGPAGAPKVPNWECPDLFELPVDGDRNNTRWVLEVDSGGGSPNGGSAGQYFVGRFDGTTFHNDNPPNETLWIDYGRDCYATQSYSNIPQSDGRRIWISWMNGMPYAGEIPTFPWRGAMTFPREVTLTKTREGIRLRQNPIRELATLRKQPIRSEIKHLEPGRTIWNEASGESGAMEIIVEFKHRTARRFGINVLECDDSVTPIGYDAQSHEMYVDRRKSGLVGFSDQFAGVHSAPLPLGDDDRVKFHIIVDACSVEVFGNDGDAVITDLVFPDRDGRGISLFSEAGETDVTALECFPLKSVWPRD